MSETTEPTDIFLWANSVDGVKDKLDVELYLFNKNYTVYAAHFAKELNDQIRPLFLYEMLNYVAMGAAMGLVVRNFEDAATEENVLERIDLGKVPHAQEVVEQMSYGNEPEIFSEADHEFKRIKGVVAKFSHPGLPQPFFIAKLLPQSQVLKKAPTTWSFDEGSFGPFRLDAGLKITPDNQVLVIGSDIFAFNAAKFERMFGYDVKLQSIADKKVAEIEKHFRLVYPDGQDMQTMVRGKKKLIKKIQDVDVERITQDQLMDHAEEMQLDLMTDDSGAIIIMEPKDMDTFVGLLNDDYVTSDMTGIRYEVKGKKRLDDKS